MSSDTLLGRPRSTEQRRRRPTPVRVIVAIAAASSLVAAFADAQPTGHGTADIVWRMLAGAIVPIAAADSRRWSWFFLSGTAAAVGRGLLGIPAGLASLALTLAAGFGSGRRRWMGAGVGALAVQALLRGVTYGPVGIPTVVAVSAAVPVLVSSVRHASRRLRRTFLQGGAILVVVVIALGAFTAVSGLRARDRINEAIDFGNAAVDAAKDGDPVLAAALIGAAGEELDAVSDDFGAPWISPARFIPVLGQHVGALQDLSEAGGNVADVAADVLVRLDPDEIIPDRGRVDVGRVEELVAPMNELRRELGSALVHIEEIDDTWLLEPASERVDDLGAELIDHFDTVTDLDDVLGAAPGLLGRDGQRRYLVMFMTPSESRAAGGFAANWAELEIDNGQITVAAAGRGEELNAALPEPGPELPEAPESLGGAELGPDLDTALYEGFAITRVFQNLPAIVDFPTMAAAGATFFEQATGRTIDGVIGVDADAMAGIVALTGPVELLDRTFDAGQLREFVLRGQYSDYVDDEDARVEILDALTFGVFEALVSRPPPSITQLIDVFGPLVEQDHLRMASLHPTEAPALAAVGLDDPFPRPAGQDLLAVITQNLGENKIDAFLQRELHYTAIVDPDTGAVTSRLEIVLTNTAPSEGLPPAVIGNNDLDFRPGTNRSRVQIYSPLDVVAATVAGDPVSLVGESEGGWRRYRRDLFIDSGASITLTVDFAGTLELDAGYVLDIQHQPLVNDDAVTIDIQPTQPWKISTASGVDASGRATLALGHDVVVGLLFGR